MRWTPELVAQAAAVFRSHSEYALARDEVQRTVRDCSESGLRSAFKAAGLPSPVMLLRPSLRVNVTPPLPAPPLAPTDVAPPCDSGVEQSYPPCSPEQVEEIERACVTMPRECEAAWKEERIAFIPDAHIPSEDKQAWETMLRVVRFWAPRRLVVLGDLLDFEAVSSHAKAPDKAIAFASELREGNRGLNELDALDCEIRQYISGNHEARQPRNLRDNAAMYHELGCLTIQSLLNLDSRGWGFTPYQSEYVIGSLRCSHDFGDAGPYATKRAAEVTDSDCIFGHTHRLHQHHGVSRRTGQNITATSAGWIGDYGAITYMNRAKAIRDWSHGMAIGTTRRDGSVHVEMVRFVDGEATVDGQRV